MLGTTLKGRYRLTAELGRGAMGTVYRARDQMLDRDVAVKVTAPGLFDAEGTARFLREAKAVARLNHPNIVTLHDVAEDGGTPFLVLEVVEGGSLRDVLPVDPATAVEIGRQLCRALAHAHDRGVVHRDLKPENVLFARREPAVALKLMDFGLSSAQGASRLTRDGMVLGTLAYLAPEQALAKEVDGRADLYSLGVLLYELVTGRVPFRGGSPQAIIAQHLNASPEPPRSHNPRVPAALETLILRLLEKDPAARPAGAAATLAMLDALADPDGSVTPLPEPAAERVRLPEPASEFVARPRELAALRALVADEAARLVTLTGPGGTGKTRLALRLAADLAAAHPGGVCFVELAALADPTLVTATIARALGLPEDPMRSALDVVGDQLATRTFLLVLDNFEQLLGAAGDVATLLEKCAGLRVIVTSRERLRVEGEREFAVPPLDLPAADATASGVARSPAVALFVARARAVRPGFEVDETNASAIARICGRLDGLPLAIELAAARVKLLPPAALAEQLGEIESRSALDVLEAGGERPERQRSQRAAIAWSYALLDAGEQRLFRRLATFRGSIALEAARDVCAEAGEPRGALLDRLGSLVDKSLLLARETTGGDVRFEMLQTILEFASEKLRASGEAEAIEVRHFEQLLARAQRARDELKGPRQREVLDELERDLPNVRVALDRARARGAAAAALRLCTTLRWFWLMRGYSTEGRTWFRSLLASGGIAPAIEAESLYVLGNLAQNQGDLREAATAFESSLARYRTLADREGIAGNLGNLGLVSLDRGDPVGAGRLLEEGLQLRREIGDRSGEADALHNLTMVAIQSGALDRAQSLGEESLAMMRELGNSHHASACISCLGQVAMLRGDDARASAFFEESLAMRRALNDDHCSGDSLVLMSRLALRGGDEARAREQLGESVRLLIRAGARASLATALEALAVVETRARRPERAAQLLGAAEGIRETSGAGRAPLEQSEWEEVVSELRRALGESAMRGAWVRGRAGSLESLLTESPPVPANAAS